MTRVGGQHRPPAPGPDTHDLQSFRMSAELVNTDPRRDFLVAVMEGNPALEDLADYRHHVLDLKRHAKRRVAHAPAGAIRHLGVLHVVPGPRKQIVVPAMVVVHMAYDDVLD